MPAAIVCSAPRTVPIMSATHEVTNQVPPLTGHDPIANRKELRRPVAPIRRRGDNRLSARQRLDDGRHANRTAHVAFASTEGWRKVAGRFRSMKKCASQAGP